MNAHYLLKLILSLFIIIVLVSCNSNSSSTATYTISTSVSPSEAGTISPSQGEFESGEEIQITATSNENWIFVKWEGDLTGTTNPATFTIEENTSIQAIFEKVPYPLTVNIEGEGTVTEALIQSKATDYPHGSLVELTAEPSEGWKFVEWQGDVTGSQNPTEINIDGEKTLTAIFERKEFSLAVNIEGEGNVTETVTQSKTTNYLFGSVVELLAVPDEGWSFTEWQGDLTGDDNPSEITIDGDKNVTTNFEYGFSEDFQNGNNGMWVTTEFASFADGVLHVEGLDTPNDEDGSWHGAYYNQVMPNNFRADFEFSRISPERSRNTIAIWFAISNSFEYLYQVGFTQKGTRGSYQVYASNEEGGTDLINWTDATSDLNVKAGEVNKIVINLAEGQADLFINGAYVASFPGDLLEGGFIGFYTFDGPDSDSGGQNIVNYDNVVITMPNEPVAKPKFFDVTNSKAKNVNTHRPSVSSN